MNAKICTNIEQSKKLIELEINVNTADMHWQYIEEDDRQLQWFLFQKDFSINQKESIPAWSLSALLSMLDFPSLTQNEEDEWEVCVLNHKSDGYIEVSANNPVDACVAMIEKLHELKML